MTGEAEEAAGMSASRQLVKLHRRKEMDLPKMLYKGKWNSVTHLGSTEAEAEIRGMSSHRTMMNNDI